MSTSLRDQLLKAGLINKSQANEVERQHDRQQRQPKARQRAAPVVAPTPAANRAQSAKVARDHALNLKQQEKAQRKALAAQVKQLVTLNRIPFADNGVPYNFVDGDKIRKITVGPSVRERLGRNEIAILRFEGGYALVTTETANKIRERDRNAVFVAAVGATDGQPVNDGYEAFAVPDDLIW